MAVEKNIILKKYHWAQYKSVFVTGFVWVEGQYFTREKLAKYIEGISSVSFDVFREKLKELNGQFSVIIEKKEEIWMATSHTWSFPFFYHQNDDGIFISDDPEVLLKQIPNPSPDVFSKNYFLLFGVTPGDRTLVEAIFQIQPGELLVLKGSEKESFSLLNERENVPHQDISEEKLHKTILEVFEKYYGYLKDKQVLLPLTSGYDSRLLACLLKEFGHENVLCATWGRKENTELNTAQKVAKQLDYPHIFIEYTPEMISGFPQTEKFQDYAGHAGHLSSMPFLQDYFAIDYLLNNKIINKDTVAMPGYSGDFFAGSHLDVNIKKANDKYLLSKMIQKYSSSYPLSSKMLKDVEHYIVSEFLFNKDFKPWQNYELWDFQNRQCKFISNANHAWFYHGIEVLMPLFDKVFIEFFEQVSFEQKLGANYYNTTLENQFFTSRKVKFDLKTRVQPRQNFTHLKKLILNITPRFIRNYYYPLNDNIFYREITAELRNSDKNFNYKHPVKSHFYNSYIMQWYLQFIEKTIKGEN